MDKVHRIHISSCFYNAQQRCTVVYFNDGTLACSVCGSRDYLPNLRTE